MLKLSLILLSIFAIALAVPRDYVRERRHGVGWDVGYGSNYGGYDGVYDLGVVTDAAYGVEANYRLGNYQTGYYGGYNNGYDLVNGYVY